MDKEELNILIDIAMRLERLIGAIEAKHDTAEARRALFTLVKKKTA